MFGIGREIAAHFEQHTDVAGVPTSHGPFIIPSAFYGSKNDVLEALDKMQQFTGTWKKSSSGVKTNGLNYLAFICSNMGRNMESIVENVERLSAAARGGVPADISLATDLSRVRAVGLGRGVGVASALVANCPARAYIDEQSSGEWRLRVYCVHAQSCLKPGTTHVAPVAPRRDQRIIDFFSAAHSDSIEAAWTDFCNRHNVSRSSAGGDELRSKFQKAWARRARSSVGAGSTDHEHLIELLDAPDASGLVAVKLPGASEIITLMDGSQVTLEEEDEYRVVCPPENLAALADSSVVHTDHAFKILFCSRKACVLLISVYDSVSGLKRVAAMAYCSSKSSRIVAVIFHHLRAAVQRDLNRGIKAEVHIHDCVLADGSAVRSAWGCHIREQFCLWHLYAHTNPLFMAAATRKGDGRLSAVEAHTAIVEWQALIEQLDSDVFAAAAFGFAKKYGGNAALVALLTGSTLNHIEAYAIHNVSKIPGAASDNMANEGEFAAVRRATEALNPTRRRAKFINASSFLAFIIDYMRASAARFRQRREAILQTVRRQERLALPIAIARASAPRDPVDGRGLYRPSLGGQQLQEGPAPRPTVSGFQHAAGAAGGDYAAAAPLAPLTSRGAQEAAAVLSPLVKGQFNSLHKLCGDSVPMTWTSIFAAASANDYLSADFATIARDALEAKRDQRESGAAGASFAATSAPLYSKGRSVIRSALLAQGGSQPATKSSPRYIGLAAKHPPDHGGMVGEIEESAEAFAQEDEDMSQSGWKAEGESDSDDSVLSDASQSPGSSDAESDSGRAEPLDDAQPVNAERAAAAAAWSRSPSATTLQRVIDLTPSETAAALFAPAQRLIISGRPSSSLGARFTLRPLPASGYDHEDDAARFAAMRARVPSLLIKLRDSVTITGIFGRRTLLLPAKANHRPARVPPSKAQKMALACALVMRVGSVADADADAEVHLADPVDVTTIGNSPKKPRTRSSKV
jgi:hypothetical protein